MSLKRAMRWVAKGIASRFAKATPGQQVFLVLLAFFAIWGVVASIVSEVQDYRFEHMSAAEHLVRARIDCGISAGEDASACPDPDNAFRELWAISKSSPEYGVVSAFLVSLQHQHVKIQAVADAKAAQAKSQAFDQMGRNIRGEAHDSFTCATSTENKPIVSFDGGSSWWVDDGRCAQRLQKAKDNDAEISSYLSTTIRVDTDMDSFWLPDEERICQSYPDDKGKVSVIGCNPTGTHRDHNIPVKFWGGVERNTISDWKCRREKDLLSDEFVCRAID
jgi:hypothetical protein